jgi:three-Cys-motif partner protein
MARYNKRLLYIDGFAGPGKYSDGERGSPLIALETARDHQTQFRAEIIFLFIEKDQKRFEHLQTVVEEIKPTLPQNFRVECIHGTFDDQMQVVLDYLDSQKHKLAPSLVFIDPFGFSHTPFRTVERIMQNQHCEILVTFMYEEINRFLNHPDQVHNYDLLFGTPAWRKVLVCHDAEQRRRLIHDVYLDQLRRAKIRYVRSFEMMNHGNSTDYFLFFGTNSPLGLEKMKEPIWRVDPVGSFQFSDFTDANKTGKLFEDQPDFDQLASLILARFRGQAVSIEALADFVVRETPFLRSHFKAQILKPMETAGTLSVVQAKASRRRGTFPDGTILRFQKT